MNTIHNLLVEFKAQFPKLGEAALKYLNIKTKKAAYVKANKGELPFPFFRMSGYDQAPRRK